MPIGYTDNSVECVDLSVRAILTITFMPAVTWFVASTNQRHSAFLIPHFTFRIPHFTHSLRFRVTVRVRVRIGLGLGLG